MRGRYTLVFKFEDNFILKFKNGGQQKLTITPAGEIYLPGGVKAPSLKVLGVDSQTFKVIKEVNNFLR